MVSGYTFGNPTVRQPLMKILVQNMPAAYQLMPWRPFILHDYGRKWLPLEDSYKDIRFKFFDNVRIWENVPLPDIYSESKDNVWSLNKTLIDQTASFRSLVGTPDNPKPLPGGVKIPRATPPTTSFLAGAGQDAEPQEPALAPTPEHLVQTEQDAPPAKLSDEERTQDTKPLSVGAYRPKFCIKCGARLKPDKKFCIICEHKIDG